MADQRCPTCGKWNAAEARTCRACGTELASPEMEDPKDASGTPAPGGEEDVPEWLAKIRAQARQEDAAGKTSGEEAPLSDTDWLGRLRQADVSWDDGPPEEEPPDWLKEQAEGLGAAPAAEAPAVPAPPPASDQDWIAKLRDADGGGSSPAPQQAEAAPAESVPDWLARIREQQAAAEVAEQAPPAEPEPAPYPREEPPSRPLPPLVLPDMDQFETRGTAPLRRGTGSLGGTSPLRRGTGSLGAAPPSAGPVAPPPPPVVPPPVVSPPVAIPPAASAPAKRQPFDDDSLALARRQAEESKPSWLSELTGDDQPRKPSAPSELPPQVPALILGDGGAPADEALADLSAGSIDVPEWFSEVGPDESVPPAAGRPDLAPATLPAWLEAMRPVETFRSSVEIASEEEQVVEAAGPLAGLRGVLLAEPIVALPRMAPVGSSQLELTERHYAQAELIHRLIEDEERERPARAVSRSRVPAVRWAIGVALFLAVLLPTLFSFPAFPLPAFRPIELDALVGLVNRAPTDRPALLIVDYEPGYVGELEAVVGPLLDQVMGRRIPIATLGTRPTSPPLADRLLRLHATAFDYAYGRDYVHLGYLPSGPTSIQAFANQPRQPLLSGFLGAEAQTDQPAAQGWEAALVGPVQSLRDFSLVILVTSSADEARAWTEQTGAFLGDTPLVMVTTAGAEPMVRPYYESSEPQVEGLLSGEPAAVSYEVLNGRPGAAMVRWNAFGSAMMVAETAIGLGLFVGLGTLLVERRRR